MLRLGSEADFHGGLFHAILRRLPDLDIVCVQDVGLSAASDPDILAWAASEGRILLTHDRNTMSKHAYDRVRAGLPMPGVFIIRNQPERIGLMLEETLLVVLCSSQEEWKGDEPGAARSPSHRRRRLEANPDDNGYCSQSRRGWSSSRSPC